MAQPGLPELSRLVSRAQKGDRAAFERIVHGTARMLYAQVVLTIRDRQKAEDVTQDAFLAAWKGIGSWREEDSGGGFIAWLQTVARNAAFDALRRDQRQKRGGLGQTLSGAEAPRRKGFLRWERRRQPEPETQSGSTSSAASPEDVAGGGPGPAETVAGHEAQERALVMLAELPEEYRRVLAMRYLAGAEYAAIREQLGLSDGALRGLLNRGMALLRERMTRVEK